MALVLVLTVPATEVEQAADALWSLGVMAVEERAGDGSMVQLCTSLGDDPATVTRAAEAFPARWRWHLEEVDDRVAETWRQHVQPSWITQDLVVVPAWVPFDAPDGVLALRIEPGTAFGMGDHPTTMLTLRALGDVLWNGATVLDIGCGSGVLSVAAARLGASTVEAIDISDAAVTATQSNAAANGVGSLVHASTTAAGELAGPYDVIVANILAPALVGLAGELKRLLQPAGVLVISGVHADRHDHVAAALAPLQVTDRATKDGWAVLTLRW
jgi:ribosomal protein L11 methyltransferase